VLELATPHVPHNWESHMFFETETRTLFCADLLTQMGDGPAVTSDDIIQSAIHGCRAPEPAGNLRGHDRRTSA
jgi:hypothetical protein